MARSTSGILCARRNTGSGEVVYDLVQEFRVMQTGNPRSEAVSHIVRAGATESIPFLFRVSCPGIYLLSFRGAVAEQEREDARKLGAELPSAWTGRKIVFVDDAPTPSATKPAAVRVTHAGTGEVEA